MNSFGVNRQSRKPRAGLRGRPGAQLAGTFFPQSMGKPTVGGVKNGVSLFPRVKGRPLERFYISGATGVLRRRPNILTKNVSKT